MGHVGISVAVAGSSTVQMVLLLAALRWRMGTTESGVVARSAARTLAASVVAAGAGWGVARLLTPEGPAGGVARALPGLVGLVGFMAVFAAVAWGMQSPELEEISRTLRRRLGRTRSRGEA